MKRTLVASWIVATAIACKTQSADSLPPTPSAKGAPEVTPGGPGALLGDGPFEGELDYEVSSDGQVGSYVLHIKEPKVRLDLPGKEGGSGIILYDTQKQLGTMYMQDASKKWTKLVDLPKSTKREAKIERTGKHNVVAGFGCEEWIVSQPGRTLEACVVGGVKWGESMRQLTSWLPEDGGVALRVRELDTQGKERSRIEAKKITRSSQGDALFAPPG